MDRDDVEKVGKVVVVGGVAYYVLTSEPVQNGLNSLEKTLKSNGHDVLGGAVGVIKKGLSDLGNVAKASPYTPAIPKLSKKITFDEALQTFKKGDHIAVDRIPHYTHHGIYESYGRVIEYNDWIIQRSTLNEFLGSSHYLYCVDSEALYSPDDIVRRAKSRIGERNYNPFTNNCEHFARWCRNGD